MGFATSDTSLDKEPPGARQHTIRSGWVLITGGLVFLLIYRWVFTPESPWQMQALCLLMLIAGLTGLLGVLLARLGRHRLAMGLMIGVLGGLYICGALLIQQLGIFLAVCAISNTVVLAALGLPPSCRRRVLWAGLLVSAVILAIHAWKPPTQAELPVLIHVMFPLVITALFTWLSLPILRRYSLNTLPGQNLYAMLGAVLALGLVLGGILVVNTVQLSIDINDYILLDQNRDREDALQNALYTPLDDIQLLSTELHLQQYLAGHRGMSAEDAELLFENQVAEYSALASLRAVYSEIQVLDRKGQEVLRLVQDRRGDYELLPAEALQDVAQEDYYRYAVLLPEGNSYISRLELGDRSPVGQPPEPILRYASPVYADGSAVGVVVINLSAESFLNLLAVGEHSTFLVDTQGNYLYHSQPDKRFGLLLGSGDSVRSDYPEIVGTLYSNQENLFLHQGNLFATQPVTIPGEIYPRWYLASYLPLVQALMPVASALAGALALLLGVLLVSVPLTIYAAGRIASPLGDITRAANRMAAGDLAVRAPAHGTHEINTLAQALNGLAGSLQSLVHNLEERVAERTTRLAESNTSLQLEVAERQHAEQAMLEANQLLAVKIDELETYNREISLLAELGEALQACHDTEHFFAATAGKLPQLFPHSSGALYLLNGRELQLSCSCESDFAGAAAFPAEVCPAMQPGLPACSWQGQQLPACRHLPPRQPGADLCVPLQIGAEQLGLLYLRHEGDRLDEQPARRRQRLVQMVAKHLSLALSNLLLREDLREQAIRDPLTGLYNRRYMEEYLLRELWRAERSGYPVSLIMLDLDHFKGFNDSYGHAAGDEVLRQLGRLLLENIRAGDIACRYGGEELLLILPEAPQEAARQRAEEIRYQIGQLSVQYQDQACRRITASLGVASYPVNGHTLVDLIERADRAMYKAKRRSRNCVVVYNVGYLPPNPAAPALAGD